MDDRELELAWEARQAELRQQYPGIAGEYKVFKVMVWTEADCNPKEGEFSVQVSGLIEGWVGKDDVDLIYSAVWEDLDELDLPEDGFTEVIAYESGEHQDVFWHKWYCITRAAAAIGEQKGNQE